MNFFINTFLKRFSGKYFGSEIIMQSYFVKNRSPYLDPVFIKYLLTTKYAGVYSKFFTHNPIKRFKGQLPYAYIIKNSFPQLLQMMTGKGYRPMDLLSQFGKLRLVLNKLSRKNHVRAVDPFAVREAFNTNLDYYRKVRIDQSLFNLNVIMDQLNNPERINDLGSLTHAISLNIFLSETK